MPKLEDSSQLRTERSAALLPVTVIVAARNEARNLPRCLESLGDVGEVYVVDSQSTDPTVQIAQSYGAQVVQFHYQGGWPKKRQWAMESLPLAYDWIFLVDADEALTPELANEIRHAIQDPAYDGYYIALRMFFLDRELRHSGANFYKLSLFRRGKGRFECRLKDQDQSMADMEVHEHIVITAQEGSKAKTAQLRHRFRITSASTTSIPTGRRGCGWLGTTAPGIWLHRCSDRRPSAGAGCARCFSQSRVLLFCFSFINTSSPWAFWTASLA
jgi:hypothetical protein